MAYFPPDSSMYAHRPSPKAVNELYSAEQLIKANDKFKSCTLAQVTTEILKEIPHNPIYTSSPDLVTKDKYPLLLACYIKGYHQGFYSLLHKKEPCHVMTPDGDNILHIMAIQGTAGVASSVFKQLVALGASMEAVNKAGCTPYYLACAKHRKEILDFVDEELARTVDVSPLVGREKYFIEQPNLDGYTPFLAACLEGNVETVRQLARRKANLRAETKTGENAFHLAALNNHFPLLNLLKEMKVPFEHCNKEGLTPAEYSRKYGTGEAGLWLQGKVQISADKVKSARKACMDDSIDVLRFWLASGININADTGQGFTLLHIACKERKYWAIPLILERKPNPESLYILDSVESSPLTSLILGPKAPLECVPHAAALLRAGADPNKKGEDFQNVCKGSGMPQNYPLDLAILQDEKEVRIPLMTMILAAGAIVDDNKLVEKGGLTHSSFLFTACRMKCPETVNLLLDSGAKFNGMRIKAEMFTPAINELLIRRKAVTTHSCMVC